jgi:hypothetical protein
MPASSRRCSRRRAREHTRLDARGLRPTPAIVAVKLSRSSYEFAQRLVRDGHVVHDARDDWSEHQPSAADENAFIAEHGWREYARWHLGVDDERREETKARYKYPFGDFKGVHRCALLAIESRAGQYDHRDIQSAAAHLHGMLESKVT